jgi:hypothetical protein
MFETHPTATDDGLEGRVHAAQALAVCAEYCTACADACLAEEAVAELRRCIRLCLDCADLCAAAGRVVARQTESDVATVSSLLTACMEMCERCSEQCEGHAGHHDHCRLCAEACRRCATACQELLESVVAPAPHA